MNAPNAAEWLRSIGLTGADAKPRLLERAAEVLDPRREQPGQHWLYVPGRIEVFGKHTDYAGGRSLVCPASRGFCSAFVGVVDDHVRVHDVCGGESGVFPLDGEPRADLTGWRRYVATVVRRVAGNFPGRLRGVDVAFASDLPQAAGLSSSSALMVSVLLALVESAGLRRDPAWQSAIATPTELAAFAACVENGASFGALAGDSGVGTSGGSEDHTAMLCGEAARLSQFAFVPPRLERSVPLRADVVFVIGVSGVVAEKTGAARDAYNAASRRVGALLDLWRQDTGRPARSLAEAIEGGPDAQDHLARLAAAADAGGASRLAARLHQFILESTQLVPAAADAFDRADWTSVGELAERSHRAADAWLGNQVAETNALVASARAAGALAASAFGAGFGGSAWALVERDDAGALTDRWRDRYAAMCPHVAARCAFFTSEAGPPAAWR